MTVIRAFIAVSLSDEVLRGLSRVVEDLKARIPGHTVRWVAVQNMHLTLKFLGDVPIASLEGITEGLASCAGAATPFPMKVGGLGAFPSTRKARVVWVGLSAPPALGILQRSVEAEMSRMGYPPEERPFSPHLTIGRVARTAGPADVECLGGALEGVAVGDLGTVRIRDVHLYQSDLRPSGPVYTRLFSARLSAAP